VTGLNVVRPRAGALWAGHVDPRHGTDLTWHLPGTPTVIRYSRRSGATMTDPAPGIDFANLPAPAEGFVVALFITVRKVARSRRDPLLPAGPGRIPDRGRPVHRPAARQACRQTPRGPPWLSSVTAGTAPASTPPSANLRWCRTVKGVSRINRGRSVKDQVGQAHSKDQQQRSGTLACCSSTRVPLPHCPRRAGYYSGLLLVVLVVVAIGSLQRVMVRGRGRDA
jgi:hypothetical protein